MKVILAMVMSVDGKITQGDDSNVRNWTSTEDQMHFQETINSSKIIIMGSDTYRAAKDFIELSPERKRIVLTRNPEKFDDDVVEGQLEFSDATPNDIIKKLVEEGHSEVLLAGGGKINASFFKEHLVDEMHLTIEPKIFGTGKPIVSHEDVDIDMELKSIEKLNGKGTLLLTYKIL